MSAAALIFRLSQSLREGAAATMGQTRRWALVLAKFVLVQLLVQAVAALGGIIIVRTLAKQDYAYYTIANSVLPALFWLANSGVTFAVSGIGGRVWQDPRQLGQVVVTAFRASRVTVSLAAVLMTALLAWLLARNGAPAAIILLVCALVLFAAAFQFVAGILITVPRLRGEIRFLQRLDLMTSCLRLALVAAAALIWFDVEMALFITALTYLAQSAVLRRRVGATIELAVEPAPEMLAEMRQVMKRQWLNEIYYVTQGQVSVFLLSVFGTAASVADLGALGRIGVIFTAFGAAMQGVILPRFARCQDPRRLPWLYGQILAMTAILAALPAVIALILPQPLLWLLGPNYANLSWELALVAANSGAATFSGIAFGLNAARAWIIPGWVLAPASVAAQLGLMAVIGITTLPQVLWISILSSLILACIFVLGAIHFGRAFVHTAPPAQVS